MCLTIVFVWLVRQVESGDNWSLVDEVELILLWSGLFGVDRRIINLM